MFIIIDAVLILLLVVFLYSGYKQGFVKAGIGFLCFAVSFVLALILSPIISTYVYDNFISQRLISSINNALAESSFSLASKTSAVIESIPKFLTDFFGIPGVSISDISAILAEEQNPARDIAYLIRPAFNKIISPVILILITAILTFLSRVILKKFRKATKNIFIGKVDSVLGLAFGGLKYVVLVFIVVAGFKTVMSLCSKNMSESLNTAIEKTVVTKHITDLKFNF